MTDLSTWLLEQIAEDESAVSGPYDISWGQWGVLVGATFVAGVLVLLAKEAWERWNKRRGKP